MGVCGPRGVLASAGVPDSRTSEISLRASYKRGSEEFARVLAFSDGLFAIAMTLLVVAIGVPALSDAESVDELADALNDKSSELISFVLSFAVIGRYWLAHHQFFSRLGWIDGGMIAINLVYLASIAFLPFPTDLLGTYFENPLAVSIYAVSVAIVSGLEVVLLRHAQRREMLLERLPDEIYRWAVFESTTPVAFFLASVPIAFVSTTAAVACWLLAIPFATLLGRWQPAETDRYFPR
jgi:uncharacterized membrane protein